MSIISRWREKTQEQRDRDAALEYKHRIRTTGRKDWVTRSDIEALEEAKAPWLAAKRRRARLQERE